MVSVRSGLSWFMRLPLVLICCCDAVESIAIIVRCFVVEAGYVKEGRGAIRSPFSSPLSGPNKQKIPSFFNKISVYYWL